MWVKLGIRKLVSLDGKTAPMTEQESSIVNANTATSTPRSTGTGYNQAFAVPTPSPEIVDLGGHPFDWGTVDDDGWVNATNAVLDDMGLNGEMSIQDCTDAPVSN